MITNRKRARAFVDTSSPPAPSPLDPCAADLPRAVADAFASADHKYALLNAHLYQSSHTDLSSERDALLPYRACLPSPNSSYSSATASAIDTDAFAAYSLFSVCPSATTVPLSPAGQKKKRTLSLPQLPQVKCFYLKLPGLEALLPPKIKRVLPQVIPFPKNLPPCDDKNGHYIVRENDRLALRFTVIRQLGQGTFGKVVECYDSSSREHVAVKIIRNIQKYRDAARIELRVLSTIKHVDTCNSFNCIHLRECFEYRGHICLVTDLLKILLYDFMDKNRFIAYPGSHIQAFGKQLIRLVAFLHDLNLIHTDLKPENILLHNDSFTKKQIKSRVILASYARLSRNNNNNEQDSSLLGQCVVPRKLRILHDPLIQIIDFGLAVFDDEPHSPIVSTRHYRAPEIILEIGWLFACDMWSVGCILAELAIGEPLFRTHENLEHLAMIERVCGEPIDKHLARLSREKSTAPDQYFTAPYDHGDTPFHHQANLFAAASCHDAGAMIVDELKHFGLQENDVENDDDDDDDEVIFDSKTTMERALSLRYPCSTTSSGSVDRVHELDRIDLFISRRLGLDVNFDYTLSSNYGRNQHVMDFGNFTFWWFYLDLLRKLLQANPLKRIDARTALNHPWFNLGVEDEGTV